MVTEKMIEAAVNAVSENVDWVSALAGSSYGDASQVMRDALEAALSTDAEPVAIVSEVRVGGLNVVLPNPRDANCLPIGTKLYAAHPAPSVAVELEKLPVAFEIIDTENGTYLTRSEQAAIKSEYEYNGLYRRDGATLSAQVQDVAVPEGWLRQTQRYSKYPWFVEREDDGWHLRNHEFIASCRDVSIHDTAAEAMAAAPAAKLEAKP